LEAIFTPKGDRRGRRAGSVWNQYLPPKETGAIVAPVPFTTYIKFKWRQNKAEMGSEWGRNGVEMGSKWGRNGVKTIILTCQKT
jgi:hypothetical protein